MNFRKQLRRAHIAVRAAAVIGTLPWIGAAGLAQTPAPAFVAPPRTIADITAILDQEKPDPDAIAKRQAAADAKPPTGASRGELAKFLYERCNARIGLGRLKEALSDCEKAVESATGSTTPRDSSMIRWRLASLHAQMGDPKKALQVWLPLARDVNAGAKGMLFIIHKNTADAYIQLGDFSRAESYLGRNQSLLQEARGWPIYVGFRRAMWDAEIEGGRAILFEARGQYREAEPVFRRIESLRREALRTINTLDQLAPPRGTLEFSVDFAIASQGRMKARQGRIAEGEVDVRRALLSRLKSTGKYHLQTAKFIGFLANMLVEQGRFAEAEQLTRQQIEIHRVLGVPTESQNYASVLNQLASILNLQGRWSDAEKAYAELDDATKSWEPARREALQLNPEHIVTLYNSNNLTAGLAAAERLLARQKGRFGEGHIETALTRGFVAIGVARIGRDEDALREFKNAIPILIARSRETDEDDAATVAAREQRAQLVIESYIALLARTKHPTGVDPATESFRLADNVRGQSVQRALAASSARSVAANPALAELVRKAQDLEKQIGAQLGLLNNVLALPPEQRDDNAVKTLQADIDKMRAARDAANREIAGKFRNYSALVQPPPTTVDDVRATLRADEAFLSFYFGRDASFVWAVPKTGPVGFAAIAASAGDIDTRVQKLRQALEPQATTIADIPPFDVAAAHELYGLLLKPVEAGWKSAKNLIVTTNGALGLLPLGLLPSAPSELNADARPYFAGYRDVPWLARTHAVTLVPSAAALRTLRQLPPSSDKRERMIGFGDPLFSKEQAAEQQAADAAAAAEARLAGVDQAEVTLRGLPLRRRAAPKTDGVNSAQLAMLPRLPDTADELKSIALALQADPAKVLRLGKAANEDAVRKADLFKYKIIVFATHGLVPGELDGLHEPALALSAPDVAGVPGDGLLTMGKILALKLDADWVVLSACNTGAASGAGAEAASGLGRAFFYAGTRAILVTNWSVHSQSARELVTDLFARQTADPKLTRGEALRQAMMALMDGKGFTDETGKTVFTYAHPLFWAPYSIIGDGSGPHGT